MLDAGAAPAIDGAGAAEGRGQERDGQQREGQDGDSREVEAMMLRPFPLIIAADVIYDAGLSELVYRMVQVKRNRLQPS